jgi:hypothetical protein
MEFVLFGFCPKCGMQTCPAPTPAAPAQPTPQSNQGFGLSLGQVTQQQPTPPPPPPPPPPQQSGNNNGGLGGILGGIGGILSGGLF